MIEEQQIPELVSDGYILDRFGREVERVLVGETNNAKLLYLAHTSRVFEKPVSIVIKGVSSGGKSSTVEQVLKFFPPSAYIERTGGSERMLAYSTEDFRHRHIVIYEAAGMNSDMMSYLIRTLISEGCIKYETVEKTEQGLKSKLLIKEGPTGLILTTTSAKLHSENETRFLSLGVNDTPQQTKNVMHMIAGVFAGKCTKPIDYNPWHEFQTWLARGERRVVVPFAEVLDDMIPGVAVRLRRDFSLLLTLICSHALLHRATRERDLEGRIIATLADYAAVRELIAKLFSDGIEATVPQRVRETVNAVADIMRKDNKLEVSQTDICKHLGLDKHPVHDRVQKAIQGGFLLNLETKEGMPARIVLHDPMPEEIEILPTLDQLRNRCTVVMKTEGVKEQGNPVPSLLPLKNGCNATTPIKLDNLEALLNMDEEIDISNLPVETKRELEKWV
jgi:hypothetical protein